MDLILTHDYSDFDAVAAQLAASKLRPGAKPVLAPHLRRDVRHFITLYGSHLPFVAPGDLPREKVERVLVVDSQTWQNVKRMGSETQIEIIDHHKRRVDLQSSWVVQIEPVGAATTLVVERLRADVPALRLTDIEATLILLGIYADTGSLTFGKTTPRDVHAAGWVLEQGAMLDVVREFMSHPLSEAQLELYELLLDNIETVEIADNPVVLAVASAPGFRGDIAVLAHQLRDLLDPAALFLLIELEKHVQLVARANETVVDVGEVARAFGGGGHARAAAARLKGKTLGGARQALLEVLGARMTPGVRVGDLMSINVHTLHPDARVDEAAEKMSRYGHEGYPVVDEDGRLVGLATRRAVDRAMGHGLEGVRVAQVMEAGGHGVRPADVLAAVRQVMVEHGWGQVPVVDDGGRVVGIITRTDLIKHAHDMDRPQQSEMGVGERLPLLPLFREAGRIAQAQGASLYVVGGFVRDLLLGRETVDIDFVVEGDAIKVAHAMRDAFGGRVTAHDKFRTANWHLDDAAWRALGISEGATVPDHVDFATARREFYHEPTTLPTVERSGIKLDLHRRDFTINTLAIRLDPGAFGALLDFYGGRADLEHGIVRALHSMSFVDDPTRMLRAVRYEQRFGFEIERRTEQMIERWLDLLDRVSGARLRHEIERLLGEPEPEKGFRRLDDLGVLGAIHPGLAVDEREERALAALRRPGWEAEPYSIEVAGFTVMMAARPLAVIEEVCERLRVRRSTTNTITKAAEALSELRSLPGEAPRSAVVAVLDDLPEEALLALWALTGSERVRLYAETLRHIHPVTTGDTLKGRGLKPGPAYGAILWELRAARLDGRIESDEDERALLEELIEEWYED